MRQQPVHDDLLLECYWLDAAAPLLLKAFEGVSIDRCSADDCAENAHPIYENNLEIFITLSDSLFIVPENVLFE